MNWCPTSPAFLQLAQFTSQTFREVKPKRRSTKGGKQRNKSHQQPTKDEDKDARHTFSRWNMKKQSQNQKNFEELVWNHPCWVKRYHNYQPIKALQPLTHCTSQVRPMVLWPTDWSLPNYSLFINGFTSSFWPDIASTPGACRISSLWTQIFTASRSCQIFGISTFSRNLPSWRASSNNIPKKKMRSKSNYSASSGTWTSRKKSTYLYSSIENWRILHSYLHLLCRITKGYQGANIVFFHQGAVGLIHFNASIGHKAQLRFNFPVPLL